MIYLLPVMLFLAACGEDDGPGGTPDILLGFSGVLIFGVIAWLAYRYFTKKRGKP